MSEFWKRAQEVMPGGVNSPVRSFKHVGMEPVFIQSAAGAEIVSVAGKRYIDFCMGFGPHILGHSPPVVVTAVNAQVEKGTSFGACHPFEVELCELLLESYPFLESARLVNSGTEAVMTALRVARAHTGRSLVLKMEGCYHGHFDGLLVSAGSGLADLPLASSKGVPRAMAESSLVSRLDTPAAWDSVFEKYGKDLAAVIVEPIPANEGLYFSSRKDLCRLAELTRACGACLIFDEVISGFRVGLSGACGLLDIQPDLVTLGKVIGGGLPLAAILGKREWLDELAPVGTAYQAGTFSGNVLSVSAGLSVVRELRAHPPYQELERRTTLFADELRSILERLGSVQVLNIASLFWFRFGEGSQFPPVISQAERDKFGRFYRNALEHGVYFPPSPYEVSFISTAHTDEVLVEALGRVNDAVCAVADGSGLADGVAGGMAVKG